MIIKLKGIVIYCPELKKDVQIDRKNVSITSHHSYGEQYTERTYTVLKVKCACGETHSIDFD